MADASSETIARLGINAVEAIFLSMGWIFREQPISDWGIDAHAEEVRDEKPTGKLIALQIKSGESFFKKRGENYVFYGRQRHLEYWQNHSLPVFLILHNPETRLTLWQKIERRLVVDGKDGAWSIEIPPTNVLSKDAEPYLARGIASDPEAVRRFRITLDMPLLMEISEQEHVFFSIQGWVNKTLNFRQTEIRYDDPDKEEPDHSLATWLPAYSISDLMELYFPWLIYTYTDSIEEYAGEVAEHKLEVELNDLGRSILVVEQFYKSGPEHHEPPEPPAPGEDDMDEDEWQEYQFQRALEQDWEDEFRRGG